jgi:pimeloyl-ACP methyl ester carboxylesterase
MMAARLSMATRWLNGAASSLDRAIVRATARQTASTAPRVARLSHDERIDGLGRLERAYASVDLFPTPPEVHPTLTVVRSLGDGGSVFDAAWPSGFTPHHAEIRDDYLAHLHNQTACARLFLGHGARPVVIALHGYLTGHFAFEERAFPVRWMQRRGFDVALLTLPFHARRADPSRRGPPPFPGADPRFTIEGCAQAVHDVRGLARFLVDRGAPAVGVMGMSLGGYVSSLLATTEPKLAFAIPVIPLASFGDFARDQGRLGKGVQAELQHRAYEAAMRVVSPLARPAVIDPGRILVVAASHDQVTPKRHAERLATHFGARLVVFDGGHLLQFGRADAFRAIGRFWRSHGLGTMSHRLA